MKRAATAIALVLPLFAASGASATDLLGGTGDPHIDQQLREKIRWSGLYVGFGAQAGSTTHDTSADFFVLDGGDPQAPVSAGSDFINGIGAEGVGLSGTLGYDQRLPGTRWVLGIFGNYVYSEDYWETDFGASKAGLDPDSLSGELSKAGLDPDSLSGELSKDNEWTLGGRVGVLVGPRAMVYAGAGYTQADFSGVANIVEGGTPSSVAFGNQTFDGYTGLLGLEVKKNDFMSFVIEGRYTQYDEETLFDGRGTDGSGFVVNAEPSEIKVLGELRFKLITE